jgi:hypothetical protein
MRRRHPKTMARMTGSESLLGESAVDGEATVETVGIIEEVEKTVEVAVIIKSASTGSVSVAVDVVNSEDWLPEGPGACREPGEGPAGGAAAGGALKLGTEAQHPSVGLD